jgi:hypothetical protein
MGGYFFFNVWDRISENEFADVVTEAMAALFPHDPPHFLARTPHGYHDVEQIRQELNAAGFGNISVDTVNRKSKDSSPRVPAIAYCQGTPLRNEIEARDASRLEEATRKSAEGLARRFGTGAIEGRIRAFVITATRYRGASIVNLAIEMIASGILGLMRVYCKLTTPSG